MIHALLIVSGTTLSLPEPSVPENFTRTVPGDFYIAGNHQYMQTKGGCYVFNRDGKLEIIHQNKHCDEIEPPSGK